MRAFGLRCVIESPAAAAKATKKRTKAAGELFSLSSKTRVLVFCCEAVLRSCEVMNTASSVLSRRVKYHQRCLTFLRTNTKHAVNLLGTQKVEIQLSNG